MLTNEVTLWLDGQAPRKSNQRRILYRGRKPILAKSKAAIAWQDSVIATISSEHKLMLGGPKPMRWVDASFLVFYESNRSDLSVELILDTLQKAQVLSDDRYTFRHKADKVLCKRTQGVMVRLREYEEDWHEMAWTTVRKWASFYPRLQEIVEEHDAANA
jgi:hypothetical protein